MFDSTLYVYQKLFPTQMLQCAGIFPYIWVILRVNVGRYGSFLKWGLGFSLTKTIQLLGYGVAPWQAGNPHLFHDIHIEYPHHLSQWYSHDRDGNIPIGSHEISQCIKVCPAKSSAPHLFFPQHLSGEHLGAQASPRLQDWWQGAAPVC